MTNPVDAAIAAANQKAQEQTATQPAAAQTIDMVPATTNQSANAPTQYVQPQTMSLDDLENSGMSVDDWLKVKEHGLLLGSKATDLIKTIKVRINDDEITPFTGLRVGNPPTYFKTYDQATEARGGSWAEAKRKAALINPAASEYIGADIQMTLIEDIKNSDGAVLAEAGTRLGHSTSVTNKAELVDFLKSRTKAGLKGQDVLVEVGFKRRTNTAGNVWGTLTFKLLGAAEGTQDSEE